MKRPNIIVISSDQHRFDCLGVNGSKLVKTPNLDRLATEGINFTKAYTPCPVCTPARVSMITGQYPSTHKVLSIPECSENPKEMDKNAPNYFRQLKNAGYYLCYVGKWHLNSIPATDREPNPFDFGIDEYISEGTYFEYCKENNIKSAHFLPKEGKSNGEIWKNRIDEFVTSDKSKVTYTANTAIDMLRRNKDKQFFLRWDPSEPHLPSFVPIDYAKKYENTPIWQSCVDDLKNKPYALRNLKRSWEIEDLTDEDISKSIGLYLAEVELMDYNIGRLLDEIDALGLSENTAIIYTTDHGDMCGSHRLVDKHFNMYDDITRVPLIIKYTKMFKEGTISNDYVCNAIDLASTICDIANVDVPQTFEGISLKDNGKTGRKDITSAYYGGPSGLYTQRMLRNDDFKYVYNATDIDELYDMKNDTWELNNLVYNDEYNFILGEMRKRLIEALREMNDPIAYSPWIFKPLLKNIKL